MNPEAKDETRERIPGMRERLFVLLFAAATEAELEGCKRAMKEKYPL